MKTRTKIILTLSGALFVAGIGAAAALGPYGKRGGWHWGGGMGAGHMLRHVDINKDGVIGLDEVEKRLDEKFSKFDRNNDGSVTKDEIEAMVRERIERRVKRVTRRFDRDKDGRITIEEFGRFAKERFSWNDLNENGKITGDELPRRLRHMLRSQETNGR